MTAHKIEINSEAKSTELKPIGVKRVSRFARLLRAFAQWLKGPDMTFEQWERLERKYSPHSSHHAQIYYRERGL